MRLSAKKYFYLILAFSSFFFFTCEDTEDYTAEAVNSTGLNKIWNENANQSITNPVVLHGFESGMDNDNDEFVGIVEPYKDTGLDEDSMRTNTIYAKDGKYALRTELEYGDVTQTVGIRSEANQHYFLSGEKKIPIIEPGQKRYYGFSILLDPNEGEFDNDSVGDVLFQTKHGGRNGVSGDFLFQLITKEGKFHYWYQNKDHQGSSGRIRHVIKEPYERGIWYDFVLEHYPSIQDDGKIQLYYKKASEDNYQELNAFHGPSLIHDMNGYIKWGIYKSPWENGPSRENKRVVYHDNIKVGLSFQDADPSLVPPLPITNLTLTESKNASHKTIHLNWTAPEEADFSYYNIYRSSNSQGDYTLVDQTSDTNYQEEINIDQIYYYLVVVFDSSKLESKHSIVSNQTQN